jgi:hypothetical protein
MEIRNAFLRNCPPENRVAMERRAEQEGGEGEPEKGGEWENGRNCLLPFAFCLVPFAFYLLPFAFCLLPSAFCKCFLPKLE